VKVRDHGDHGDHGDLGDLGALDFTSRQNADDEAASSRPARCIGFERLAGALR
jgi:hypothetical protein